MIRAIAAGKSVKGPVRKRNEDAFYIDEGGRLFLVADGMGGQRGGECAANLAIDVIQESVRAACVPTGASDAQVEQVLRSALVKANDEIMSLSAIEPMYHGMGTTIVFAYVVPPDRAYVGGIGDSRCYHLRKDKLRQLTTDHSLVEALRAYGMLTKEQEADQRFRNTLWNYLGTKEARAGADILVLEIRPADRMLLTTDGLTSVVDDATIQQILKQAATPNEAVAELIKTALAKGSRDNITCVAIFFVEQDAQP